MINIFYGERWVVMGMLIMICLMPSYTTSAFGAKFDQILAGIGRPETVVTPWVVALAIGLAGLFLGLLLPSNIYITNYFISG